MTAPEGKYFVTENFLCLIYSPLFPILLLFMYWVFHRFIIVRINKPASLEGKKKILPVWLIELSLIKRVKLMRIIKILVSIYQALMFQALFFICTNLILTNTER